ncbi:hypothetical protein TNCV_2858851 [Trichonephila clavipes]|nr:hypothetical protein TNCV_2858851 [Trichonephila clavipes]
MVAGKVLRTIFGAVLDNNSWRKRYPFETCKIFNIDNIIKSIKLSRMRCAEYSVRMNPKRTAIFNATPSNKRRWKECVDEDFAILKVKNWRSIAGRRAKWEKLLRKAQVHKECKGKWCKTVIRNPRSVDQMVPGRLKNIKLLSFYLKWCISLGFAQLSTEITLYSPSNHF